MVINYLWFTDTQALLAANSGISNKNGKSFNCVYLKGIAGVSNGPANAAEHAGNSNFFGGTPINQPAISS